MPVGLGNTFLNATFRRLCPHLWIVLSDRCDNSDTIAIVNLSTWRNDKPELNDPSCIVLEGDHPFVRHKSYIYYRQGICSPYSELEKGLACGVLTPQEDCSEDLVYRALCGAAESQFTPNSILDILRTQALID